MICSFPYFCPYELKKLYKTLDTPKEEVRHRKWDERFHTVGEEIRGEFTGANREEEIER